MTPPSQPPSPSDVPTSERGEEQLVIDEQAAIDAIAAWRWQDEDHGGHLWEAKLSDRPKIKRAVGGCYDEARYLFGLVKKHLRVPKQQSTPPTPKQGDVPEEVTLEDCPPGLFDFGGVIGFKTEYKTPIKDGLFTYYFPEAYCVESGEYFWGGTKRHSDRKLLKVRPLDYEAAIAAYRAAEPGEWQKIEAAPRDGTRILLFADMPEYDGAAYEVSYFEDGEWEGLAWEPTHWMPLPKPPSSKIETQPPSQALNPEDL